MTFEAEWARCSRWVAAALKHGDDVYTLSDVEFAIRSGEARFWPGRASALVAKVEEFPRARWLMLWLAGGDLTELRDELRPQAEAWGKAQNCSKVVIIGRAGWYKSLCGEGYSATATVVGKDLT